MVDYTSNAVAGSVTQISKRKLVRAMSSLDDKIVRAISNGEETYLKEYFNSSNINSTDKVLYTYDRTNSIERPKRVNDSNFGTTMGNLYMVNRTKNQSQLQSWFKQCPTLAYWYNFR
jgi:arsenate reductase-like glutaredoxin family protein